MNKLDPQNESQKKCADECCQNCDNGADEELVNGLSKEIEALKNNLAEVSKQRLMAVADLENYRKRAQQELSDTSKYAVSSFAKDLLSVADSLDNILKDLSNEGCSVESVSVGIKIMQKEFESILKRNKILPIDTEGKKFDPNFHMALKEEESDLEPGTIVSELQKGYTIGERPLRPTLVVVSKKRE